MIACLDFNLLFLFNSCEFLQLNCEIRTNISGMHSAYSLPAGSRAEHCEPSSQAGSKPGVLVRVGWED